MPRKARSFEEAPRLTADDLVEKLAAELRKSREYGQPIIDEEVFPTGKIRVVVIWDEWDRLPMEDRTTAILQAYNRAEDEKREKIALASGLTVPEAVAAGMLPFVIIPAVRKGDPVTMEQCRQAMIDEGASRLLGPEPNKLRLLPEPIRLRFATLDDAEAARRRLLERLPGSDQVWVITQEVGSVEDWSQR